MDANEYARKVTPAEKSLSQAIKSAEWIQGPVNREAKEIIPLVAAPSAEASAKEEAAKKEKPVVIKQGDPAGGGAGYHVLKLGSRTYRVGGLEKNNSLDVIKITLRVQYNDLFHLDNLDLTQDVHRRRFIERAHEETRLEKELIKRDLGKLLLALEETQTNRLTQKPESSGVKIELSASEHKEAMTFLQSPKLLDKIAEAFENVWVGGRGNQSFSRVSRLYITEVIPAVGRDYSKHQCGRKVDTHGRRA